MYKHLFLTHVYNVGGAGLTTPNPTPIDTEFDAYVS